MQGSVNLSNQPRDLALDEFRGFTVFLMLFVNLPGSWSSQYSFLEHAKWNGCYPADFIFPFFLWIVGFSSFLQKGNRLGKPAPYSKWLFRFLILLLAGLFLNAFPKFDFSSMRIPGVLQRIALLSFVFSLLLEFVSAQRLVYFAIGIGILVSFLLKGIAVSGAGLWSFGWYNLELDGNLASYLDQTVLGIHIWKETKTLDPEGILSSVTALSTVALGGFFASWQKSQDPCRGVKILQRQVLVSLFIMILGYMFSFFIPWNKSLWTMSFVFWTGGFAIGFYSLFQWFEKSMPSLFSIFGKHALFVFFWSGVMARTKFYAEFRKSIFGFFVSETNDKDLSSFLFTCLIVFLLFCVTFVYSGIWRILTMRAQANFLFSSKVPK